METSNKIRPKLNLNFALDLRWAVLALALVILLMLAIWRPWQSSPTANSRTVEVTGEATVKAEPDEYLFYPNYQFAGSDKQTALSNANAKNTEVVAKLKELGIADSKIKTATTGYDNGMPRTMPANQQAAKESTYTLSLIVTVDNKGLAQKTQDYLNTTSPSGYVSPQASFSESKRKSLESEARDIATKDARSKADQSARNLGFKIGKIKEVKDGQGFDAQPYERNGIAINSAKPTSSPGIQSGENEFNYTVTVTYFMK